MNKPYDVDIVGIDLETGGLDGYECIDGVGRVHGAAYYPILEIAVVVPLVEPDGQLNIEKGERLVVGISMSEDRLEKMHPWALEQHEKSGLLQRLESGEGFDIVVKSEALAELTVLGWLQCNWVRPFSSKEKSGAMVYGNNIGFDMNFINAKMPELHRFFSYRKIDVSSINVLSRTPIWQSFNLPQPEKVLSHTALSDITETTDELNAYTRYLRQV
ncbi:oligoribonuclease [Vibrio fluvialis]|uniref:oligoribonuclease n=1 Tax=Vibrio fluvialis TaxID=676 RepID=UPI001EECDAF3|nr:oligoribonuclease [Vibrio fluvialis]MCG6387564.1 oligoribonuclease [Vibrio fluvialis]